MRKLNNHKKAVSPVIASVLMILVTMIGMTLLFAFVSSYSDNYKAGIGSSVMESLTIEDIWLSPRLAQGQPYDRIVEISVYNTGKIDSTINSIYVNGLKLSTVGSSNFNLNAKVPMGGHVTILAERSVSSDSWVSGHTYAFKIATQRGSNFEIEYRAPP
jgi:flagellin-like protein